MAGHKKQSSRPLCLDILPLKRLAMHYRAGPTSTSIFPAAMGCSFSPNQEQLSVVYGDRTIIVWGVKDPAKV